MGHIAPVVGIIWHTSGSGRAIEDVAIDTSAIDDGSQVVDRGRVGRMPREVNGSRGTTLGRDYAEGSERKSSGVVGDEHLS